MKSLSYRELRKILRDYDDQFEFYKRKGKGSHRAIEHPDIDGERICQIIPCHNEGADILAPYLTQTKRKFKLPKDIFD